MPPKRPIRRGQLISPWGIGSMIDFPKDESLMTCGLDVWPYAFDECPDELLVTEERLQHRLGVTHFRQPPEFRDPGSGVNLPNLRVPFIRFPQWHYCPKCGAMEKLSIYGERQRCKGPNYANGMSCHAVPQNKRPWLIPVRFVAVCGRGHIEDFPFMEWVHREKSFDVAHKLRLRAGRSASTLSGIKIECTCGGKYSLAGAFNPHSLINIKPQGCSGLRPWLGEDTEENTCGHELFVLQRGASNVYFPEVMSSIYLPQWESDIDRKVVEILEKRWDFITRSLVDGEIDRTRVELVAEQSGISFEKLLKATIEKFENTPELITADSEENFRRAEYEAILTSAGGDNQDFYVVQTDIHEYDNTLQRYFDSISLIHKLRETRVLAGFSRYLPEDGRSTQEKRDDLAINVHDWLPATVVRGEGLFFEFDQLLMKEWENRNTVINRTNILTNNFNESRNKRGQSPRPINPRFILLHTFAHILINQLSYECGYGSSAIRERIYCNTEDPENIMNGVLIYTASGDSEGSMGGLVRQGNQGNLENIIISALNSASWCSSDPVCIQSKGQGPDNCNLAACHSCTLLPETSCEEGNRLLDRALLVGTIAQNDLGYFSDLRNRNSRANKNEKQPIKLNEFRSLSIKRVSEFLSCKLEQINDCEFVNSEKNIRVVCLVSKDYPKVNYIRYWYSFRPQQREFLNDGNESYIVFGCGSQDKIVIIPREAFIPLLDRMRMTGSKYWHVELFSKNNKVYAINPKHDIGIDVSEYLID